MPDYTLGPAETLIREAHIYAQIPSGLTIAPNPGYPDALLRNDGSEPITLFIPDRILQLLPGQETTIPGAGHYTVTSPLNGRFTIRRQ